MACGILVPQPGNLSPLALKCGILTTGTPGKTLIKILSYEQEQTLAFKLLNIELTWFDFEFDPRFIGPTCSL